MPPLTPMSAVSFLSEDKVHLSAGGSGSTPAASSSNASSLSGPTQHPSRAPRGPLCLSPESTHFLPEVVSEPLCEDHGAPACLSLTRAPGVLMSPGREERQVGVGAVNLEGVELKLADEEAASVVGKEGRGTVYVEEEDVEDGGGRAEVEEVEEMEEEEEEEEDEGDEEEQEEEEEGEEGESESPLPENGGWEDMLLLPEDLSPSNETAAECEKEATIGDPNVEAIHVFLEGVDVNLDLDLDFNLDASESVSGRPTLVGSCAGEELVSGQNSVEGNCLLPPGASSGRGRSEMTLPSPSGVAELETPRTCGNVDASIVDRHGDLSAKPLRSSPSTQEVAKRSVPVPMTPPKRISSQAFDVLDLLSTGSSSLSSACVGRERSEVGVPSKRRKKLIRRSHGYRRGNCSQRDRRLLLQKVSSVQVCELEDSGISEGTDDSDWEERVSLPPILLSSIHILFGVFLKRGCL